MNKLLLEQLAGIFASAVSAIVVFLILKNPAALFFSVAMGFLTYLFYQRFVLNKKLVLLIKHNSQYYLLKLLLPVLFYVLSSIVLIYGGNISHYLFLNWFSIPLMDWLNAIATILLTTLLPGYFILTIFDHNNELSKVTFLALVPLVSVFFSSLIAFIAFFLGYSLIDMPLFLMVANAGLVLAYLLNNKLSQKDIKESIKNGFIIDLNEILILILIIAILSAAIFVTFFTNQSFLKGDMWREFSIGSTLSNMSPGMMKTVYGSPVYYVYWIGFYLTTVFASTSFPLINIYILLAFLNVFSIISFYSLGRNFFKNKNSAIISTIVWSLFSGLGWIYVLNLPSWLGPTSDRLTILGAGDLAVPWSISKPFGFWANDISIERALAFISVLMLLSVLFSRKLSVRKVCFLTTFLVAISYLFHVLEAGVFILIFWPVIALISRIWPDRTKILISLSILSGLIIVYLLDFVSIYHYYITTYLIYFIVFTLLITLLIGVKSKISQILYGLRSFFTRRLLSKAAVTSFIGVYLSAVIVYLLSNFQYSGYMLIYRVVPWYLYPLKLGVAGFIVVGGIGFLILKGKRLPSKIKFLIATIFVLFFFGVTVSYIKTTLFPLPYEEMREVDEMFPFIALAAGWVLAFTFSKFSKMRITARTLGKKFWGGILIAIIITSGSMSSLLSPEVWSLTTGPWGGEQAIPAGYTDALNFLRINGSPNSTIATVPNSGDDDLVSLVGLQTLANIGSDMNQQFFASSGPQTFYGIASTWNVQHIYMSNEGYQMLQEYYGNSFLFKEGLSELPVCFNDSGNVVYKVTIPPQYLSTGYGITSANLTLNGHVNISGNFNFDNSSIPAIISAGGLRAGLLNLTNAKNVSIDGVSIEPATFSNITIISASFTTSIVPTLETNSLDISPISPEGHVSLNFPDGYNFILNDTNNSAIKLVINDKNSGSHEIILSGGVVTVENIISPFSFVGRVPLTIDANGTTNMVSPIFYLTNELRKNISQVGGVYESRIIQGPLTFKLIGADNDRIFINDFVIGTDATTTATSPIGQQQYWPGLTAVELPNLSLNLILSVLFFAITFSVIVTIFTYCSVKRKCF